MNRREFIGSSVGAVATTMMGKKLWGAENNTKTVRIGVIGTGGRGIGMMMGLLTIPGVEILALCDINEINLNRAAEIVKKKKGNSPALYSKGDYDYRRLLDREDLDAVFIATPIKWHTEMSVDAMNAGKDVGIEVVISHFIDDLWKVVEAKEKTGRHFMMLENYIYMQWNMMIYNMVQQGVFGNPYYGECSYIHNCKFLQYTPDGKPTWRGDWALNISGNNYPTHALGPVSKWFGINDGDRIVECVTMGTQAGINNLYAAEKFGKDSKYAKANFKANEMTVSLLKLASGGMITQYNDVYSPGPADFFYQLQGTKARYNSRYNGISLGEEHEWTGVGEFVDKYGHAYWTRDGEEAKKSGHGGGDYFVLRDFVDMVRQDREPWIDVYDACTWSSISECSRKSLELGNKPVAVPDFTKGKWKSKVWRKDNMKPV